MALEPLVSEAIHLLSLSGLDGLSWAELNYRLSAACHDSAWTLQHYPSTGTGTGSPAAKLAQFVLRPTAQPAITSGPTAAAAAAAGGSGGGAGGDGGAASDSASAAATATVAAANGGENHSLAYDVSTERALWTALCARADIHFYQSLQSTDQRKTDWNEL